ncbi:MAG TPA: GDSL-type esterase/lipase family protein [Solirubrobacteraceae bacterium]
MLAFGDSITNGGGELQWGVALQSWAHWVARGLGMPYTGCAVDGATVGDVIGLQIPAFVERSAAPDARFDVGCLYIGVNDVRALDWDAASFEREFAAALEFVCARSDRVLAVTAPLNLGRPPAGAKVLELNAAIVRCAAACGALVLDLSDFGARNLVMADHVHPTAFGQIAIAERALDVLAGDGMRVAVRPRSLIAFETTRRGRLRGDLTYVWRRFKVEVKGWVFKARSRLGLGPR